jgi:DNA-binding CsgD family transcriptional regulator
MNLIKALSLMSNVDHLLAQDGPFGDYPCNTYAKDYNGLYIGGNENQANTVGFRSGRELIGLNDYDFLVPVEAKLCSGNDKIVIETQQITCFTEPFSLNGEAMIAMSIKAPLRTKTNKIIGVIGLSILQKYKNYLQGPANNYNLTERQLECLLHLVKGKSIKQIAKQLTLSPRTVEHYIETVKFKMKCESRAELIEKAFSIPLIKSRL